MNNLAMIEIDESEPVFTIGGAAKKLGVAVPMLRMYEKGGLIIPFRNETRRRLYSFADLKRFSYIKRVIKVEGLNLEGIRRLMALLPCREIKPFLLNFPKSSRLLLPEHMLQFYRQVDHHTQGNAQRQFIERQRCDIEKSI